MATRAMVVCLLGLAAACGGESQLAGGGGGDGGAGAGVGTDADADADTDADADAGGRGDACTPLTALPSEQTVTIAIKNTQAVDRFVATACDGWTPVEVERLTKSPEPLLLSVPWSCGCECNGPQPDGVTRLHRIAPGETYALTWDARELVPDECEQPLIHCYEKEPYVEPGYFAHPVEAGSYRVSVKIVDAVPAGWSQDGADFQGGWGVGGGGQALAYPSLEPSADLELPGSGDVTVAIDL